MRKAKTKEEKRELLRAYKESKKKQVAEEPKSALLDEFAPVKEHDVASEHEDIPTSLGTVTYRDLVKMRKAKTKEEKRALLRIYKESKKAQNEEVVDNIPEEYKTPEEFDVTSEHDDIPTSLGSATYRDLVKMRKARTKEEKADLMRHLKESTSRDRFKVKEETPILPEVFDKKLAKTLIDDYCTNDIAFIKAYFENECLNIGDRVYNEKYSYNVRARQRKKTAKNAYFGNKRIMANLKEALKLERSDNDRYSYVINMDVNRVRFKTKGQKEDLYILREELIALLELRDEINRELCDIYSGKDVEAHNYKRVKGVESKYKKKLHGKYKALYNKVSKGRADHHHKEKLYGLIDEDISLNSELKSIKYSLKKTKYNKKERRQLKRRKKDVELRIKINNSKRERVTKKVLREIEVNRRSIMNAVIAYTVLFALIAGAAAGYYFRNDIMNYANSWFVNIKNYITNLLNNYLNGLQ